VCDLGGWTDTWFAEHGAVCNLAVRPGARVVIFLEQGAVGARAAPVTIVARDFGERYEFDPRGSLPGAHPLIEAALAALPPPPGQRVVIELSGAVPPGASMGTSAAITVALIGALSALAHGERLPAAEVASLAHAVEADRLGRQSGVQDQWASACGGALWVEMPAYPQATATRLRVPPAVWADLDARLVTVWLGRGHDSSAVHEQVIAGLRGDASELERLRRAAHAGRVALVRADLGAYGAALRENTAAQAALHPDLVGPEAREVIELAGGEGATGWKVNGAGGSGGSVTVLCGPEPGAARRLVALVRAASAEWKVLAVRLSAAGLRVRVSR